MEIEITPVQDVIEVIDISSKTPFIAKRSSTNHQKISYFPSIDPRLINIQFFHMRKKSASIVSMNISFSPSLIRFDGIQER